MTDTLNVSGVVLPADTTLNDSLDARALALAPLFIAAYLRRAQGCSDQEELIARDAFVAGFAAGYRRGGRDAVEACQQLTNLLNEGSLQEALARVALFIGKPHRSDDAWRELRKA